MDRCDVLIIGGGPAGSTCAWKLKQAGLDVAVLDKKFFPRDKVCAGWITPAVVEELALDIDDYRRTRVLQPIRSFITGLIDRSAVENRYDEIISYGIRRYEFDDYLLKRSGARLYLGETLKDLQWRDSHWLINEKLQAPLLIGAGGHFCPVARHLGAKLGGDETPVTAQEVEFAMSESQMRDCRVAEDTPELYFCNDLKGYAWCFRKGNFLNIGLGREDNHKLGEHVIAFCEFLKRLGRIPHDIPNKFNGHAYLLYPSAPREIIADRVMLIGDSAGLAYPQSGEGIRPAVESALLAAQVIVEAKGNYSQAHLENYHQRLIERFGARQIGKSDFVPTRIKQWVGGLLLSSGWFSRHFVIDRWFLHRQQAALLSN